MEISYLKNKKIVLPVGIAAVCIVGFLTAGSMLSHSREEVVETVKKSIETQDEKAFLSVLPSEAKSYPFAENGVKSFLKKAQKDSRLVIDMMDTENVNVAPRVLEVRSKGLMPYEIIKDGKKWLFFDNYVVKPKDYSIQLENVDKDVILTLEGKKVSSSTFQEKFLPGEYSLVATKKYPWTTVTDKQTITLDDKDSVEKVSLNLKGNKIDLSKDFVGSDILFKGQPTGVKVGDGDSKNFGPINKSDEKEVSLKADFPWTKDGTAKMNVEKKSGFGYANANFSFKVDEAKVSEFYNTFLKEYGDANVKQSIEPFTTATEKYKKEQADVFATNAKGFALTFKGTLVKSYLNKETVEIVSNGKGYPVLKMEGKAMYHLPAGQYSPEKDQYSDVTVEALYDKEQKAWKVDTAYITQGFMSSQPNVNEESKYIITNAK
ncbi:TcaA 3rd/4th domain-containing protein [Bacillus wiedmannii]|uniref:TcaA 3rd/4th domain-containing protein n=1 Tax=Bacillus wiedmannii TaxID=1890302 RepID=UPI0021CF5D1E|nr:hypothetical protein [Bacillus wiedmannii]MCU5096696.1 hypothetical protein [Bacillus wiedmannii]